MVVEILNISCINVVEKLAGIEVNVLSYKDRRGKNYASIFNGITTLKYNTHFDDYSKM